VSIKLGTSLILSLRKKLHVKVPFTWSKKLDLDINNSGKNQFALLK